MLDNNYMILLRQHPESKIRAEDTISYFQYLENMPKEKRKRNHPQLLQREYFDYKSLKPSTRWHVKRMLSGFVPMVCLSNAKFQKQVSS